MILCSCVCVCVCFHPPSLIVVFTTKWIVSQILNVLLFLKRFDNKVNCVPNFSYLWRFLACVFHRFLCTVCHSMIHIHSPLPYNWLVIWLRNLCILAPKKVCMWILFMCGSSWGCSYPYRRYKIMQIIFVWFQFYSYNCIINQLYGISSY